MITASNKSNVKLETMNALDITKEFLVENNINAVFWHKTCFKDMGDLWEILLHSEIVDTTISNALTPFSDEYLLMELGYCNYWERSDGSTKEKDTKGRLYVLKK